ncbi:MAG: glucosamine-6-phosphate isomerase [Clostridia bacterium]
MNMMDTIKGSLLEGFYPRGWDLEKMDACCSHPPDEILTPMDFWNKDFTPVSCRDIHDFDMMMGHEIAMEIRTSREEGRPLAMILPVGPMGMYRWAVYFLKEWKVDARHVHGFNMDEWSDGEGNTLEPGNPASFQYAMEQAFYGPLGEGSPPPEQRNFAQKDNLPLYPEKIAGLKARGAKLVTVFGIGRVCHIAFWEPQFAGEFQTVGEWKKQTHRLGAMLHPLTIEQNAITSFKSRTTLVPCRANTVGPGLFLQSDRIIGGCDGSLSRGMQWQGMSLWMTLRYGPDMWVPSSFMPTLPGKLFFLQELAGPLVAECN